MSDLDDLLGELADHAHAPRLFVACGFDGVLAPAGDDRALQQSSEALNVLVALSGTTVAVVTRRPPDDVAEMMFLSGAKGGLRMIAPDDVAGMRADLGAVAIVLDTDPASLASLADGDLAVLVDAGAADEGRPGAVADADDVVEVLEELVRLRRH